MFAAWIPEALARIEELANAPAPPTGLAIARAREEVVNCPGRWPQPMVSPWNSADGVGIDIRWPHGALRIWPSGRLLDST
jgi:hypothetical protein